MGLAPYGQPRYADRIREQADLREAGRLVPARTWTTSATSTSSSMTNERFCELFDGPAARSPNRRITRREMDLAASIQQVTEEVVLGLARHARARDRSRAPVPRRRAWRSTVSPTACCCASGSSIGIWIQPAAGDAGGALGAALAASHLRFGVPRRRARRRSRRAEGELPGPGVLERRGPRLSRSPRLSLRARRGPARARRADRRGARDEGKVVGFLSGRMEFGPRALGARSILGDPRRPDTQVADEPEDQVPRVLPALRAGGARRARAPSTSTSTARAPTCCSSHRCEPSAAGRCSSARSSRATTTCSPSCSQARSDIPAVTHVDYSARVQTVGATTTRTIHAVIEAFEAPHRVAPCS